MTLRDELDGATSGETDVRVLIAGEHTGTERDAFLIAGTSLCHATCYRPKALAPTTKATCATYSLSGSTS